MKKLLLTCTMLLAIVGFSASNADAQFCMKFVSFCDGVQVNSISGGVINADWYHYDCASSTAFNGTNTKGEAPISNACPGGNGSGVVECLNCFGFGDWHFVIDAPLDGTFDLVQGANPGGTCWIDELAYTQTLGACTGVQAKGERQQARNRSTVQ